MAEKLVFEMLSSTPYGYFMGKYLHTMDGICTHYRGGSDNAYLFRVSDSRCEYYQQAKLIYTMQGRQCRWYLD